MQLCVLLTELTLERQIRHTKGKHSLAALMKLLWYWYVMRGAGSILETQETETSGAENGRKRVQGWLL